VKVYTVGIDKVLLDPANVRKHPERNLETIKASLSLHGQQTPIVIDKDWICRKGNGTVMAARALGWDTILAVRTTLTGAQATAYAIGDNRSSDLGEYDNEALAETLRALRVEEFDLGAIGYAEDEVDKLTAMLGDGILPEANGKETKKADAPKVEWLKCPKCRHKWKK
jgi:hypothetical protein